MKIELSRKEIAAIYVNMFDDTGFMEEIANPVNRRLEEIITKWGCTHPLFYDREKGTNCSCIEVIE